MRSKVQPTQSASRTDVPPRDTPSPAGAVPISDTLAALHRALAHKPNSTTTALVERAIEQLRKAGASKRGTEARYRTLINAVPDAVTLHDEQGRIIDANDAACTAFGYPLAQLKRMTVWDLNPDLPADHMHTVWATCKLGQTVTVETSNQHVSGQRFPVEVHSNAYLERGERRIVAVARDVSERKASEERLHHQARTDALTELPNRNAMLARIEEAIGAALPAPGRGPALLYVDLDRFKVLRDMLGHARADHLLAAAARRLDEVTLAATANSRFGHDEFVLLLAQPNAAPAAATLAREIVEAFRAPFELDGERFALTASVGTAQYPGDGGSASELVRHAEAAMFEAKRRGRSTWSPYAAAGRDEAGRLRVQSLLRMALDKHEFQLVYQPQVDLHSHKVIAVEALLRWHSPELGLVPPDVFIGEAENSGDIVRIGAWVIDEACRQLHAWRDAGVGIGHVAVNVSYRQFVSGTLLAAVSGALRQHHLEGDALELELTERVMVDNFADAVQVLHRLKGLGVRLMIDDFGEGFSSLNYLRHLPVDGLKISHTFLQGVPGMAVDSAICEAIVRIAHSLKLEIVAEGVETQAQERFLLALGSPLAQGFLFAAPMPPEQIREFVAQAAAA